MQQQSRGTKHEMEKEWRACERILKFMAVEREKMLMEKHIHLLPISLHILIANNVPKLLPLLLLLFAYFSGILGTSTMCS